MAKLKDGYFKNIGSAEGNDSYALLAGGGHLSYSNSGGANALVQRDASGYIANNYFYTSSGGAERNASGLGYIAGFNASDYYIRSYTSAAVKSWLGLGSNAYTSTAYLPLTGGTVTDSIFLPLNSPALRFGNARNWDSAIGHDTSSYEVEAFMTKSIGSKYRFKVGFDPVTFANGTFVNMTDADLEIGAGYCKINNNTVWHSGNDGAGSGLDADLLDGKHDGEITAAYFAPKMLSSANTLDNISDGVWFYTNGNNPTNSVGDNSALLQIGSRWWDRFQLAFPGNNSNSLRFRSSTYESASSRYWNSWKTIAFTDSNVESATKLQTARTIWGQSFDGSENVSGAVSGVTSLTMSGALSGGTTSSFSSYSTANRFYTGYDSGQANSVSCSNWFRSNNATGWYNDTYGGGIYQDNDTYVKIYGNKAFKVNSTASDSIVTDGGILVGGTIYASGIITGSAIRTTNTSDYSLIVRNSNAPTLFVQNSAAASNQIASFRYGSATAGGGTSVLDINSGSVISSVGYSKSGSSDSYMLLGGGGQKLLSDFKLSSEKVLKMVFRGYFTWTGTNSSPSSSNVVYSDFCTSYSISRVGVGRYRITFTGLKTTSSISSDTTLQIFGAGRNINSDGTPCHVSIFNVSSNYFDIITANNASPNDTSTFTLYINQML